MTSLSRSNAAVKDPDIAVRETLHRVGDRWTIYVVRTLRDGPQRFNRLKRKITNISARMLTLTLKKLERDGIVVRTSATMKATKVDYSLTELGLTFLEPVSALVAWADHHRLQVQAARERYDAARRGKPAQIASAAS
jgi:DNA-binding HxlR family transcriptional regulator